MRLTAGLSQSRLAERSGVPKPRLSQYENDHLRPSLETLGRLAGALDVPPGRLLPGTPHPLVTLVDELVARGIRPRSGAEAARLAELVADVAESGTDRRLG